MKLKKMEEIATKQVPIWQPVLLLTLLVLGYFVIPLIAIKPPVHPQKNDSVGSTLGLSTVKDAVKPLSDKLQQEVGTVLSIAQQEVQHAVQNIASQSSTQAKEFVFDNTIGKVLQNINTLPKDQQDFIKKAICK